MSKQREGRKPISSKSKPAEINQDEFGNTLACDPELLQELEVKGLVPRWVDAKRIYEMQGYNDKGWQVYKREKNHSDTIDSMEFKFGTDPSGIVRRGSLVLAVKTKAAAQRQRTFIEQKTERQAQVAAGEAEELRSIARRGGIKAEVFEGYEENEAPGI